MIWYSRLEFVFLFLFYITLFILRICGRRRIQVSKLHQTKNESTININSSNYLILSFPRCRLRFTLPWRISALFVIPYLPPSIISIIFGGVLVARLCSGRYNPALFSPFDVVVYSVRFVSGSFIPPSTFLVGADPASLGFGASAK
ncbi:hypothetical protein RHGRI_017962 [Rhododendron griersonianum]|uniref:Uncharacterized protein n=1 Tax=Rhododendron griersonianum TaxID=479676 RepID=A0AAV6JZV7_9ERIC|nr:hypothetical protein RHGRI_017962 [Rhododendron griersonianum]